MTKEKTTPEEQKAPEFKVSTEEMQSLLQRVALFFGERNNESWALVSEGSGIVLKGGNQLTLAAALSCAHKLAEADIIQGYIQQRQAFEASQNAKTDPPAE